MAVNGGTPLALNADVISERPDGETKKEIKIAHYKHLLNRNKYQ